MVMGQVTTQLLQILDNDFESRVDEIAALISRLDELVDRIGSANSCVVREAIILWLAEEQRRTTYR